MTEVLSSLRLNTKDKLLQVIAANGRPFADISELRDAWGPFPPSFNELVKALWGLQKQGEIKFKEHRQGGVSLLTNIRLSRGIDTRVFRANESRGRHRVGKDYTDPNSHHWIAQGGPIERTQITMEVPVTDIYVPHGPKPKDKSSWTKYVAAVKPERVRPILPLLAAGVDRPIGIQKQLGFSSPRITTLVTRGEQLGWLTKEKISNGVRLHLTDEGARLAAEPFIDERPVASDGSRRGRPRKTDTPTQYPQVDTTREYPDILQTDAPIAEVAAAARRDSESTPATVMTTAWPRIIDVVELEKYPLISELMTKEAKLAAYEGAAALLEGFDADLALSLLDKIRITPLESEVIAFVRSLR